MEKRLIHRCFNLAEAGDRVTAEGTLCSAPSMAIFSLSGIGCGWMTRGRRSSFPKVPSSFLQSFVSLIQGRFISL